MSAPEGVPKKIWSGGGNFGAGSISDTGRWYVLEDRDSGGLMLLDLESREGRALATGETLGGAEGLAVLGTISPDSERIAYGWLPREGGCELYVQDLDGAARHLLMSDADALHIQPLDWSVDGGRVLVGQIGSDRLTRIFLVDSQDGTKQLILETGEHWPAHLRLSPDGRFLAYGLLREPELQEHDLYLYNIPDKRRGSLVVQPGEDRLLGWTPGGGILYLSRGANTTGIFTLAIWDGRPQRPARLIHPDNGALEPVGTTRDGRFFYRKSGGEGGRSGKIEDTTELWVLPGFIPKENRVLHVPDSFPTISSAILASNPGDTIFVREGVYRENLTIDRPLTLMGEGQSSTVIDGGRGESVVHITSSSVTLQRFTITNGTIGVDIQSARPVRSVALQDCIVTKHKLDGIRTRNSGGDHTIERCILSHNGAYAVNAHQFSRSVIRDCDVFENGSGLRVGWGWHITVEGNRVYRNESSGIYPDSCYYSTFADNLLYANEGMGIKLGYISSRNIFRQNIIYGNGDGIFIGLEWGSYSRNRIYNNDLSQNRTQVLEHTQGLAGFQEWDSGSLSGGNFWSDYSGPDRDGDGIGETPYLVSPGTSDRFPLMRPHNRIRAKVTLDPVRGEPEGMNGWLEVRVSLPAGLPIEGIKRAALRLNETVVPSRRRSAVGDSDSDGVPELMVRFRWKQVLAALQLGDGRTVSISGELSSGLRFAGSASLELSGR
jgi:nitrous oxidase accessory protein